MTKGGEPRYLAAHVALDPSLPPVPPLKPIVGGSYEATVGLW